MNQTALHLLPEISARQVGRQEQPDALTYRIAGGAESAARHPFLDTLAALHSDGPGELSMTLWALQQVADEPMHVLWAPSTSSCVWLPLRLVGMRRLLAGQP